MLFLFLIKLYILSASDAAPPPLLCRSISSYSNFYLAKNSLDSHRHGICQWLIVVDVNGCQKIDQDCSGAPTRCTKKNEIEHVCKSDNCIAICKNHHCEPTCQNPDIRCLGCEGMGCKCFPGFVRSHPNGDCVNKNHCFRYQGKFAIDENSSRDSSLVLQIHPQYHLKQQRKGNPALFETRSDGIQGQGKECEDFFTCPGDEFCLQGFCGDLVTGQSQTQKSGQSQPQAQTNSGQGSQSQAQKQQQTDSGQGSQSQAQKQQQTDSGQGSQSQAQKQQQTDSGQGSQSQAQKQQQTDSGQGSQSQAQKQQQTDSGQGSQSQAQKQQQTDSGQGSQSQAQKQQQTDSGQGSQSQAQKQQQTNSSQGAQFQAQDQQQNNSGQGVQSQAQKQQQSDSGQGAQSQAQEQQQVQNKGPSRQFQVQQQFQSQQVNSSSIHASDRADKAQADEEYSFESSYSIEHRNA